MSIFYILSGLTLYTVYNNRFDLRSYVTKRILRIFPLLWLVIIANLILDPTKPDAAKILLNLTGLFGFVAPANYIAVGSWSIGNELVFYSLFPFFLLALRTKFVWVVTAIVYSLMALFAFQILPNNAADSWPWYVNPLNQVYLFFSGMLIGHYFNKAGKWVSVALVVLPVAAFLLIPIRSEFDIMIGWNRVIFSLLAILICAGVYSLKGKGFLHRPLTLLGETSYSVYLLHPIVLALITSKMKGVPVWLFFGIYAALTLTLSYFCYTYFEKWFMRLNKKGAYFSPFHPKMETNNPNPE